MTNHRRHLNDELMRGQMDTQRRQLTDELRELRSELRGRVDELDVHDLAAGTWDRRNARLAAICTNA